MASAAGRLWWNEAGRAGRFIALGLVIAAAVGCGDTVVSEPSARVAALTASNTDLGAAPLSTSRSEGAGDLLLLDREPPEALTARSRRDCGEELAPEDRVACRAALANALTRAAIAADRELSSRLATSGESLTNELEQRYGRARSAITVEETDELHDLGRATEVHAVATSGDDALDGEPRAEAEAMLAAAAAAEEARATAAFAEYTRSHSASEGGAR